MKHCLVILSILFSLGISAQAPEALFDQANEAYKAEDYTRAITLYDSILKDGYESAALYYNLGNSYYKNDKIARAILYYERAARLDPGDDDIRQNLGIANKQTIDTFEELPEPLVRTAYLTIMKMFSPDQWARIGLISLTIFVIGLALYLLTKYRRPAFIAAVLALLITMISLSLAFAHRSYVHTHRPAIVMAMSSYVKTAPGASAEDSFILHQGTKAQVTDEVDGWKKLRLPDGKIGWIEAGDVEEI